MFTLLNELRSLVSMIYAMKMFNEIESDKAGTIREIIAQNGQAVEYEQPLFIIE